MRRVLFVLYVVICFELGLFLLILPWASMWNNNFFVNHYSWVSHIALNHFVRGAVSGLGLADIWLAIYELWRLRRELGLVSSRPAPQPREK